MAWADVTLTTPESIAKYEKEINTLTELGTAKPFFDGEITATTTSDAVYIRNIKGFGILSIKATDVASNVVLGIFESDSEEGDLVDTGIAITITDDKEITMCIPNLDEDYMFIRATISDPVTLEIEVKSAWEDKHEIAKEIIGQMIYGYSGNDLNELENPLELSTAANYLVLHLIYSDLVLGFGENEIYADKMKMYWSRYDQFIKMAINRMTIDGTNISSVTRISR